MSTSQLLSEALRRIAALEAAAAGGGAPTTRLISTTAPLSGGGDLSADRTLSLLDAGVTYAKVQNLDALSVLGRAGNTSGVSASIAAGTDGHVLRRNGSTIGFGTIPEASVDNLVSDLAGKQASSSELTSLAGLGTTGLIERTGAGAHAIRTIGVGGSTQVPDRAAADGRYLLQTNAAPRMMCPSWASHANSSSVISVGSTTCPCQYLGRVPVSLSSIDILLRVAVAMTGITWAEVYVAKGASPTYNSSRSLTVVGYTSVSSWSGSTGNFLTTVTPSGGQTIDAGDHLWVGFAKLSTASPSFRAGAAADELITGRVLDFGNNRPSSILGTPTTANLASPNPLPMIFHAYF